MTGSSVGPRATHICPPGSGITASRASAPRLNSDLKKLPNLDAKTRDEINTDVDEMADPNPDQIPGGGPIGLSTPIGKPPVAA